MRPAAVAVIITTVIIATGIFRYALLLTRQQTARDRRLGTLYRFEDIAVTRTRIIHGRRTHPLAGVRARVESTGQLASRGRGRHDDRAVHLIIEGSGVSITRAIRVRGNPRIQAQARGFASALNSQAMLAESPRDVIS